MLNHCHSWDKLVNTHLSYSSGLTYTYMLQPVAKCKRIVSLQHIIMGTDFRFRKLDFLTFMHLAFSSVPCF